MKKRITSLLLALTLLFGVAMSACKKGGFDVVLPETPPTTSTQTDLAEVWSMPATIKIMRDVDYSHYHEDPLLEYDAARNEYVSAQLVMTAKQSGVSYDIVLSDLISENGNVLSRANFDVYNQHYVRVSTPTNPNAGQLLGYYPDALIPLNLAKRAGENKLVKDQNQSLWLTVYIPKNTPAGTYTGNFTLKVGEETETVPVSVRVRDFAIPDEVHARSTFNMFSEFIAGAQYSNTRETYQRYVDYMLDYRISTTQIVRDDAPIDEWIKGIKKYAADPRVTSYNIITSQTIDSRDRIIALIENSRPGLNLLDKAVLYLRDEPFTMMEQAKKEHDAKIDELIELANSYTRKELDSFGLTREDIMGVEVLITMTASIDTIDGLRTYAPLLSDLDTEYQRETYAKYRDEAYKGKNNELAGTDYGTTWWYVCVHPSDPYPHYNIDTNLVGSRVASWMQYDYDLEGMLYWGIASYMETTSQFNEPEGWTHVDVYNEPNGVYVGANGDGYLVYPGVKYGVEDPMPTIRLMSIRDGFQDYEYLYMLERLVDEYAAKYDVEGFTFDGLMRSIYDKLYTGAKHNTDHTLVLDAKREVADMIELLQTEMHGIVEVGEVNPITKKVPVTVYAEQGTTMVYGDSTFGGTTSGDGVKFEIELSISAGENSFRATLKRGDKEFAINRFVTNEVKHVSSFDTADEVSKWAASSRAGYEDHVLLSLNTDADYVMEGSGSMKIKVEKQDYDNLAILTYKPHAKIAKADVLGEDSLKKLDSLTLNVYNTGDSFTLRVALAANYLGSERTQDIYKTTLTPGWNVINVSDIQKFGWKYMNVDMLDYLTDIRLNFPASSTKDYEVYVDKMFYTYAQPGSVAVSEVTWMKDVSSEQLPAFKPVRADANLITSFESYEEIVLDMKLLNMFGSASFIDAKGQTLAGEKDANYPEGLSLVTEGNYALKIEAQGDYRKLSKKPSLAVKTKIGGGTFEKTDFTDVDKIYLDVYNANATAQNVYVQYLTESVTGAKLTSQYKATVPAYTFQTVEFVIDRSVASRLLDLGQVSQVRICFDGETEYNQAPRIFFIDNFRLHTTTEPIDTSTPLRRAGELESADKADFLSTWKTIGSYNFFPSSLSFNDDPAYIKGGTGSFKLSNVPNHYGAEVLEYTIGWELTPMVTDLSNIQGISYWVYNAYDQPIQDWVRRTIREPSGDDSKDDMWGTLQPGWNQRTITKEQLLAMGFKLDEFNIFTLMFSVPAHDACDLYFDEILYF